MCTLRVIIQTQARIRYRYNMAIYTISGRCFHFDPTDRESLSGQHVNSISSDPREIENHLLYRSPGRPCVCVFVSVWAYRKWLMSDVCSLDLRYKLETVYTQSHRYTHAHTNTSVRKGREKRSNIVIIIKLKKPWGGPEENGLWL